MPFELLPPSVFGERRASKEGSGEKTMCVVGLSKRRWGSGCVFVGRSSCSGVRVHVRVQLSGAGREISAAMTERNRSVPVWMSRLVPNRDAVAISASVTQENRYCFSLE
jgi:hypothetical protein